MKYNKYTSPPWWIDEIGLGSLWWDSRRYSCQESKELWRQLRHSVQATMRNWTTQVLAQSFL